MPETGKRRPWYAVALVAGFGAVLGVATVFGLIGTSARGEQLRPVSAAVVAQQSEDARWRERMEQKIDALTEKVAKIEGRLEKR
jgi:TolA-binding protein